LPWDAGSTPAASTTFYWLFRVFELIAAKRADGLSNVYIRDLRCRLGRFAQAFQTSISAITVNEVEMFLRALNLTARSRNNYRNAIGTLFHFAVTRGYVAKGAVDVESIAVAKEDTGAIKIFRPEEMDRVLKATQPELIPFLAIGAFAGLRHAEIQRLDWSEIRIESGFIEVKASKAKTAARRLVPITDNLQKWLLPHVKPHGKVTPFANMSRQLLWLAEDVDKAWRLENPPGAFTWKHNALRHSFISYRVADIQNVAQVALEAGNSPQMIFRNYRELVKPADAKRWFSIEPG
jgi:integrase